MASIIACFRTKVRKDGNWEEKSGIGADVCVCVYIVPDTSRTLSPSKKRSFMTLLNTSIIPKLLLKCAGNFNTHNPVMPLIKWITTATFSWIKLLANLYSCISKVFVPFILLHFVHFISFPNKINLRSSFYLLHRTSSLPKCSSTCDL